MASKRLTPKDSNSRTDKLGPGAKLNIENSLFLPVVVSRIVFRAEVFQPQRPDRCYLCNVLARFRPVEVRRIRRQNDHRTGRIRLQFVRVEFVAQADIKYA